MSRSSSTAILVARVAAELHIDVRLCRAVVLEFLHKSAQFLAENHQMNLEGLGSFRVVQTGHKEARLKYARRAGGRYPKAHRVAFDGNVHVSFTKSARLKKLARELLEETDMSIEKYGVDENVNSEQLEKQAAKGCPECGSKVVKHGSVLMCPKCGTEPFERETSG